jgi:hypothetical protein
LALTLGLAAAESFLNELVPLLHPYMVKLAVTALSSDPTSVGYAVLAQTEKLSADLVVVMKTGKRCGE